MAVHDTEANAVKFHILPPMSSASFLLIANPSPVA
jgi:hypothetical protein